MLLDQSVQKDFLEELQTLEHFRIAYTAGRSGLHLDRDDPDVKRLIEAMAFFAVRSRLAAVSNVVASQLRIFQQLYSYLLAPLPSMGILRAGPKGQFVDPTVLPKGAEIAVSPVSGGMALFRTTRDLRILPIALHEFKMLLLPEKGYRVLLRFGASFARNDEIGRLELHIDHLNDYPASLRIFHCLQEHFTGCSVIFDAKADEMSRGVACELKFGPPADEEPDDETAHPMQKEQSFFHMPEQELCLNIEIPEPLRNWSAFTVMIDLDRNWPRALVLNRDLFHLFCVPIVNLRRSMAQPILCDGTQERYPIRHLNSELGFEPHTVLGVYEVAKSGMKPLKAGIVSGGEGSYEIMRIPDKKGAMKQWLALHYTETFNKPVTIAVDGLWLQPWFSEAMAGSRSIAPYSRNIAGVSWDFLGEPVPHIENDFLEGMESYMHLLTMTNKSELNTDDLACLLQTMGSIHRGEFREVTGDLASVRIEEVQGRGGGKGMLKYVYYLRFREFDSAMRPLVEVFAAHVRNILDNWLSEGEVEVRVETSAETDRRLVAGRAGI